MKKYISDEIKNEYMEWGQRDIVFLTAPTGSGKTYFILHVFLPYIVTNKKKLLYVVNRAILKEQMEKEIERLSIDENRAIKIITYQSIEEHIRINNKDKLMELSNYDIIVADEAHYFEADALFNTSTQLSYNWIHCNFKNKLRIYISATIDNLIKYMTRKGDLEPKACTYEQTAIYGWYTRKINPMDYYSSEQLPKVRRYHVDDDYKGVEIHILNDIKDILLVVLDSTKSKGSEKWIVFVDSISAGRKLYKNIMNEITNNGLNDKVVFVTARYKQDESSLQEVDHITSEQKQSARILITTSVMDNGITLKDEELRNIVIATDTKEEFLQMLGRKRLNADDQVKVYLVNKSKEEINRRFTAINNIRKSCLEYYKQMNDARDSIDNIGSVIDYDTRIRNAESRLQFQQQRSMLKKMFVYKDISVLKYAYPYINGLYLSTLAVSQIEYLYQYYLKLLELYDERDKCPLAFLQLQWLGYNEEESEELIEWELKSEYEKQFILLEKNFEKKVGKPINRSDFQEWYNGEVRKQIKVLLDLCKKEDFQKVENSEENMEKKKKLAKDMNKSSKPLTKDDVDWLKEVLGFPYEMETIKEGRTITGYVIKKVEE